MDPVYDLDAYDYHLPEELIAQEPASRRDGSRLLVLDGRGGLSHRRFPDLLEYLAPGDALVVNDTRVFPARLLGRKETGGQVELLLLDLPQPLPQTDSGWRQASARGLYRCSKRPQPGSTIAFGETLQARVEEILPGGTMRAVLLYRGELDGVLARHGQMPLPPYIRRPEGQLAADRERYQTVFAAAPGAVAAPTAGLHFTGELLAAIEAKGVRLGRVTLHVGYGTFAPVRSEDIRRHRIHAEYASVSEGTAELVNETKAAGGRVWAVGTTTVRSLEFAAGGQGRVRAREGWCDLYIYPGYRFQVVDNLVTNFHLPRSSLLFLVSALAGRERIMAAYEEAVAAGYRFFSYGDAMAIVQERR
ncbi:MAG: tRNA preQ1(34) S-adenosylmethionine ribosyltransferase-isomerase QueA [Desulfobacteraceae bacterium]|nr:tRNA preQ1(34) S-adenosylmethionine ribosyltransferase-isomerase QueA [Desulfobacteraceae bacterium]